MATTAVEWLNAEIAAGRISAESPAEVAALADDVEATRDALAEAGGRPFLVAGHRARWLRDAAEALEGAT